MSDDGQEEIDFDRNAFARNSDPETSHWAANDMNGEKANETEKIALACFDQQGDDGLTNHDLVRISGRDWNTISPRVAPLIRKGLLYWTGKTKLGPKGKQCRLYKRK